MGFIIIYEKIFTCLSFNNWHFFLFNLFCDQQRLNIILTAVAGKLGGSAITARIIGFSLKDSIAIGIFMNTRGLMELIVLNIGFDLGFLSPEIFTIMVLMALATTFMTGPLLDLLNYASKRKMIR